MKFKVIHILFWLTISSLPVFSQSFTENFNGAFPRTAHPKMTLSSSNGIVDSVNGKKYKLNWYLNTDSINQIYYGLNGTKALVFNNRYFSIGSKASFIFNNVDLRNFTNPILTFQTSLNRSNTGIKIALRKKNTWEYIPVLYGIGPGNNNSLLNTSFLFDYITTVNLDSVDIKFECVSDYAYFKYLMIDDISLSESITTMSVSTVNATTTYATEIKTDLYNDALLVKINSTGQLNPPTVTSFVFNTDNSTNVGGIDSVKLFYLNNENQDIENYNVQFGSTIIKPSGIFTINGSTKLNRTTQNHNFMLRVYFNSIAVLGSIVNIKCNSVQVGPQNIVTTGNSYNNKLLTELTSILNNTSSVSNSSSYRGLSTLNNIYQRTISVYNSGDFAQHSNNISKDSITGMQYYLASVPSSAVTGQLTVYIKGISTGTVTNNWATEISGLTPVYSGNFTIPTKVGFYTIPFNQKNVAILDSYFYEVAVEWKVNSGTSVNASYYVYSTTNGSASSGNSTSSFPTTLTSSTFRPIARFVIKKGFERIPEFLPPITYINNINVANTYPLDYSFFSYKNISDTFIYQNAFRGANNPIYTVRNTTVISPQKSICTFNNGNLSLYKVGVDTIYNNSGIFTYSQFVRNNNYTTLSFPSFSSFYDNFFYYEDYQNTLYRKNIMASFESNSMLLNKYIIQKRNYVNSLVVHIGSNKLAIGIVVRPVILDANNSIIFSGSDHTISDSDLNSFCLLPTNSFELNPGTYKFGIQYVSGSSNIKFLSIENATKINKDRSYAYTNAGGMIKMPDNIAFVIGFNSGKENTSIPNLGLNRKECKGYILNAGVSASKYLWNTGDTTASIIVNVSGVYSVRIKHTGSNIFYMDTVIITILNPIKPIAKFDKLVDYTFCSNEPINFSLVSNSTDTSIRYIWYKNNSLIANTKSSNLNILSANNNDMFFVKIKYKIDCISDTISLTDTVKITILPIIYDSVRINNKQSVFCKDSVRLNVISFNTTGSDRFIWTKNHISDTTLSSNYLFTNLIKGDSLFVRKLYASKCVASTSIVTDTLVVNFPILFKIKSKINVNSQQVCQFDTVNFKLTHTLNDSINSRIVWYVNNSIVKDDTTTLFNYWNVKNGDIVYAKMYFYINCISDSICISDTINLSIKPPIVNSFIYTIDTIASNVHFISNGLNYTKLIWEFGDGVIDSSQNTAPVHNYSSNGSYNVKLIALNFCEVDTFENTIELIQSSINSSKFSDVQIYPNPTSSVLFLKGTSIHEGTMVYVYNVLGDLLDINRLHENKIDLSVYPSGVYFFKIEERVFKILKN